METAVRGTLAVIYGSARWRSIKVTVVGGNDFYSQRDEVRLPHQST